MKRAFALIAVLAVAAIWMTASASAEPGMRYCLGPGGPGNYVSATPNVKCGVAKAVSRQMGTRRCINNLQRTARGFVCISYWNNSFSHPFGYSHHGICVRGLNRRVDFDWG
jgi:hypothetical protein